MHVARLCPLTQAYMLPFRLFVLGVPYRLTFLGSFSSSWPAPTYLPTCLTGNASPITGTRRTHYVATVCATATCDPMHSCYVLSQCTSRGFLNISCTSGLNSLLTAACGWLQVAARAPRYPSFCWRRGSSGSHAPSPAASLRLRWHGVWRLSHWMCMGRGWLTRWVRGVVCAARQMRVARCVGWGSLTPGVYVDVCCCWVRMDRGWLTRCVRGVMRGAECVWVGGDLLQACTWMCVVAGCAWIRGG
jgi:hypothetical protein